MLFTDDAALEILDGRKRESLTSNSRRHHSSLHAPPVPEGVAGHWSGFTTGENVPYTPAHDVGGAGVMVTRTELQHASFIRAVRAPPDALAIAGRLRGRSGLAVLASRAEGSPRREDARFSFVACDPVEACDSLVPEEAAHASRAARTKTGWNGQSAAPRWIGVIPYEALRGAERPLWTRWPDERSPAALAVPTWRRYAAVVRIDHLTGDVVVEADDPASADELVRAVVDGGRNASRPFALRGLSWDEPDEAHRTRIREALRLIASGDLYEVNLARRIGLVVVGDALGLFAALLETAPTPWGFYQDLGQTTLCGASPELALSVRGDVLRSCPIKGTRPRGRDAADDSRLAASLAADPKERAELVMAVDVHRNDLGRVACPGTVRVLGEPRVTRGRTVWSSMAEVVALRRPGSSLEDVVRAVLPCGSVTGAPKVRAMEAIARLEPWRRSAYTGAFGYVAGDGNLCLAMTIRTLELGERRKPGATGEAERSAAYFAGGAIVADSDPERELEETRWKATQLETLAKRAAAF